jgi:hypothetical protein
MDKYQEAVKRFSGDGDDGSGAIAAAVNTSNTATAATVNNRAGNSEFAEPGDGTTEAINDGSGVGGESDGADATEAVPADAGGNAWLDSESVVTRTSAEDASVNAKNYINSERQFSLGLINDAFSLGFHSWWILGFVLSFCLFTVVLAFVAAVLDNSRLPPPPSSLSAADPTSAQHYQQWWNNLGATAGGTPQQNREALETMDRLTRLEGARRSLAYPLIR